MSVEQKCMTVMRMPCVLTPMEVSPASACQDIKEMENLALVTRIAEILWLSCKFDKLLATFNSESSNLKHFLELFWKFHSLIGFKFVNNKIPQKYLKA